MSYKFNKNGGIEKMGFFDYLKARTLALVFILLIPVFFLFYCFKIVFLEKQYYPQIRPKGAKKWLRKPNPKNQKK